MVADVACGGLARPSVVDEGKAGFAAGRVRDAFQFAEVLSVVRYGDDDFGVGFLSSNIEEYWYLATNSLGM